ncbi:MAG: class I SAM-dependent methyltransferase [Acidimicrobiales bacterium]
MTDLPPPNHHGGQAGFSGISGAFAAATFLIGRSQDASLACDLMAVEPGDHVVDIGCGPGRTLREAIARGAKVTGVDPAPVMLRTARLLTRSDKAVWLDGTAEDLPVDAGAATVVWSIATVHHWTDVQAGLAECWRVLSPGGRLLALERRRSPKATGHASHGWTEQQGEAFAQMARAQGFDDASIGLHTVRRGALIAVVASKPLAAPGSGETTTPQP